jgi:hypothetical protein
MERMTSLLAPIALAGALVSADASAGDVSQALQREWWQWAMSIPSATNPVYDKTGNRCGLAQRGDFWFLAGSTGGKVSRSCTIPQGVKLLVPVVNNVCFPDATIDAATCISETDGFIASYGLGDVTLTVDGHDVAVEDVRDASEWFIAVDSNGLFGYKPGVYKANIARGYWGIVDSATWAPGSTHTIEFAARGAFSLAVTYKVTVAEHVNADYLP